MIISDELAGLPVTQARSEVMIHLTLSLFAGLYVNMCEFVPVFTPFTFHWYVGVVPPFIGVAVKVMDEPGQKGLDEAAIVIPAGKPVFSIIVIVFDVAGLPSGHAILEFNTQVTKSPFTGLYV
jgi:hypothetical protein